MRSRHDRLPQAGLAAGMRVASSPLAGPGAIAGAAPEQLIGLGFRGWMAGYQSGDVDHWQDVWNLYSAAFDAKAAEAAVGGLARWVRAVRAASRAPIIVLPASQPCFGRDECLAISMIAACQHNTCPAMRACAFALIETAGIDEVLHHAGAFALTLAALDKVVAPRWIVNANAFLSCSGSNLH